MLDLTPVPREVILAGSIEPEYTSGIAVCFWALSGPRLFAAATGAKAASGSCLPHSDGASFYLPKVDGSCLGERFVWRNASYALPWLVYHPQAVWQSVSAEGCVSAGKCEAAAGGTDLAA
jgi:hypothetical protein